MGDRKKARKTECIKIYISYLQNGGFSFQNKKLCNGCRRYKFNKNYPRVSKLYTSVKIIVFFFSHFNIYILNLIKKK